MSEEEHKAEGEATNPTDEETIATSAESQVDGTEDAEALRAELERTRETIKQLTARAKKAEAQKKRTDLQTPDTPSSESVDERILKANGMSDELLKQLKRVARFNETDLISAQADPMFVAIKEKHEAEQRDKEAALGASKGSGSGKPQKDFRSSGLTPEEHKALWQKAQGR